MNRWSKTLARATAALALAALAAAPAWAQQVVARVNGVPIVLEQLDREHENVLKERRLHAARMTDPKKFRELRREALDRLVRVELLWQEARTQGLAASDKDVAASVQMARKQARDAAGFDRLLMRLGLNEAQYRDYTRKMLSGDRLAERTVQREVKITEEDIQGFYDLNPRLFKREETVKLRQIVLRVPPGASDADKAARREQLLALAQRIRSGESMDTLARQHTEDPTRQWGGELDPFARGAGPDRAIEDVAFALQPGELSDPVWSHNAWHLLKLEEHLPAKVVPLQDVKDRIRDRLHDMRGKEAVDKLVADLREKAKIEVLASL